MFLEESSLVPMGNAPSAFACGSCLTPLSMEDQKTLCSGELDDPLENVDCVACGDYFDITEVEVRVHPEAMPLLSLATVQGTEWFHVSGSPDWHTGVTMQRHIPYIHAGNRASAIDRYEGLYRGRTAYLYKFKLVPGARISDIVYDDLNEWPKYVERELPKSKKGQTVDGIRYVNRWESPGSISLLVNPLHVYQVTCEEICITEKMAA